jgi:hypothetical protein
MDSSADRLPPDLAAAHAMILAERSARIAAEARLAEAANVQAVSRCTIFVGGFAAGIAYSAQETTDSNAFNECLTIQADDQALYLRSMGMTREAAANSRRREQPNCTGPC